MSQQITVSVSGLSRDETAILVINRVGGSLLRGEYECVAYVGPDDTMRGDVRDWDEGRDPLALVHAALVSLGYGREV